MKVLSSDTVKAKVDPNQIILCAKKAVENGELICILNDYDYTVSDVTYGDGVNPFFTRLYPATAQALSLMEKKGVIIGAVSNRSGIQVAKRYIKQGISKPFIMGTYGMELFTPDSQTGFGISKIDQRYELHKNRITEISTKVRGAFVKYFGLASLPSISEEMTIPTSLGQIFIENKGVNSSFPEGLSQVYNLNQIAINKRKEVIDALSSAYFTALTVWEDMTGNDLEKFWGIREFGEYTQKNYSWSISPLLEEGKLLGITKILNQIQATYNKPIGFVLYGGDEDADAEAMIGLHNIDRISIRPDNEKLSVFGVWVNPGEERTLVKNASDLEVNGVPGYSTFLNELANNI